MDQESNVLVLLDQVNLHMARAFQQSTHLIRCFLVFKVAALFFFPPKSIRHKWSKRHRCLFLSCDKNTTCSCASPIYKHTYSFVAKTMIQNQLLSNIWNWCTIITHKNIWEYIIILWVYKHALRACTHGCTLTNIC